MIDFQVVRGELPQQVSALSQNNTPTDVATTRNLVVDTQPSPIPGLRLEVHVIPPSTTETAYEVMTDYQGHPNAVIEVESSSDIMLVSKDPLIAQLEVAGPAYEFALERQTKVKATPMVDAVGACRFPAEGGDRVRFSYHNYNTPLSSTLIPFTSLSSVYLQNPMNSEDDLLLNDIRTNLNLPIVPDAELRSTEAEITYQTFDPRDGVFTVPYNPLDGALVWNFIGKQITASSLTQYCEDTGAIACVRIPDETVRGIFNELLKTVSGTLKAASKVMKRGPSPYLKTSPKSIRGVKTITNKLLGAHICAPEAIIPQSCVPLVFPRSTLIKLHRGIFQRASPTKRELFDKIQRVYLRRYENYLNSNFPDQVYMCSGQ